MSTRHSGGCLCRDYCSHSIPQGLRSFATRPCDRPFDVNVLQLLVFTGVVIPLAFTLPVLFIASYGIAIVLPAMVSYVLLRSVNRAEPSIWRYLMFCASCS